MDTRICSIIIYYHLKAWTAYNNSQVVENDRALCCYSGDRHFNATESVKHPLDCRIV
jgi:hypothetical protein